MPELSETDLGIGGSGVAAANKALKSDGAGNSDWGDIKGTEIDSESATSGHVLSADGAGGTTWEASAGGGGTVTSVAVSGSDGVEVDSGSPITGAGTIALGLNKTTTLSTLNVEDGADVTDATNVDSAGAVMESDFTTAFSLLVQQSGTGSPESLTVGTNTILGRVTGGGSEIDDLTPTQVRSLLNVEDGATADQTDAEILTAVESESGRDMSVDGTKLDGIEASADVTDETNVTDALDGATLTDVGTPASTDRILLQDADDSNNLKYADFSEFGGGGGGATVGTFVQSFEHSDTLAASIEALALAPHFSFTFPMIAHGTSTTSGGMTVEVQNSASASYMRLRNAGTTNNGDTAYRWSAVEHGYILPQFGSGNKSTANTFDWDSRVIFSAIIYESDSPWTGGDTKLYVDFGSTTNDTGDLDNKGVGFVIDGNTIYGTCHDGTTLTTTTATATLAIRRPTQLLAKADGTTGTVSWYVAGALLETSSAGEGPDGSSGLSHLCARYGIEATADNADSFFYVSEPILTSTK